MQKSDLIKLVRFSILSLIMIVLFVFAKREYSDADFGNTFDTKAGAAEIKLLAMNDRFDICSGICSKDAAFMQAIVFPELMLYNSVKDDIESESLRVLYVQFGKAYADFSVGPFQMKPSFAEEVETKAKALLPVHWGKFTLAMHAWNEPIKRVLEKAKKLDINVFTPRIGEPLILGAKFTSNEWWEI